MIVLAVLCAIIGFLVSTVAVSVGINNGKPLLLIMGILLLLYTITVVSDCINE